MFFLVFVSTRFACMLTDTAYIVAKPDIHQWAEVTPTVSEEWSRERERMTERERDIYIFSPEKRSGDVLISFACNYNLQRHTNANKHLLCAHGDMWCWCICKLNKHPLLHLCINPQNQLHQPNRYRWYSFPFLRCWVFFLLQFLFPVSISAFRYYTIEPSTSFMLRCNTTFAPSLSLYTFYPTHSATMLQCSRYCATTFSDRRQYTCKRTSASTRPRHTFPRSTFELERCIARDPPTFASSLLHSIVTLIYQLYDNCTEQRPFLLRRDTMNEGWCCCLPGWLGLRRKCSDSALKSSMLWLGRF